MLYSPIKFSELLEKIKKLDEKLEDRLEKFELKKINLEKGRVTQANMIISILLKMINHIYEFGNEAPVKTVVDCVLVGYNRLKKALKHIKNLKTSVAEISDKMQELKATIDEKLEADNELVRWKIKHDVELSSYTEEKDKIIRKIYEVKEFKRQHARRISTTETIESLTLKLGELETISLNLEQKLSDIEKELELELLKVRLNNIWFGIVLKGNEKIMSLNNEKRELQNKIASLKSSTDEIFFHRKCSKMSIDTIESELRKLPTYDRIPDIEESKKLLLENSKSYIQKLHEKNASLDRIISVLFLGNKWEKEIFNLFEAQRILIYTLCFDETTLGNLIILYFNAIRDLRQTKVKTINPDKERIDRAFPDMRDSYFEMEENTKSAFKKYREVVKKKSEEIKTIAENMSSNLFDISIKDLCEQDKLNQSEKVIIYKLKEKEKVISKLIKALIILKTEITTDKLAKLSDTYNFLEKETQKMQNSIKKHFNAKCVGVLEEILQMKFPEDILKKMGFFMNSNLPVEYKGAKIFLTAYDYCLRVTETYNLVDKSELAIHQIEEIEKLMELEKYEKENIDNAHKYKIEKAKIVIEIPKIKKIEESEETPKLLMPEELVKPKQKINTENAKLSEENEKLKSYIEELKKSREKSKERTECSCVIM